MTLKRMNAVILISVLLAVLLAATGHCVAEDEEIRSLRIIATSDLHGKFFPWDYALNAESASGSMTQLASAIAEYRTENAILVDAGDTIQGNSADIFIGDEGIHPMILAINALGYDVCVTGNHEYNYGMETVKKTIADLDCRTLTGNVYDAEGNPIADGCAIIDVDGVRVAVIGMVTPNIARWDAVNLADCTVTDPLKETRRLIDDIRGQYDVLVGVFHMGIENEYDMPGSGVTDILNACPEFDVMVSSHEHVLIPSMDINGALVVQNKSQAQTMAVIDLSLVRDGGAWRVEEKSARSVDVGDYGPDPAMTELLRPYHERALEDAGQVIGRLEGGPLAPESPVEGVPSALVQDTPLIDLINRVQMAYSGAQVSAAALNDPHANLFPGEIRKCDAALIYKYQNTLYKLHMNGAQLKNFMEWSAACYNTFRPGDSAVSIDEGIPLYNCYMFDGVCYEINLSREPGNRIENLTWPDGTPVKDSDSFEIAVNNYRANSQLLAPGTIFDADDMPVLLEKDVRGDIGGVREQITEYIQTVKGGTITPVCDNNWKIIGNDWNPELHQKAVEQLANGTLTIPTSEDGRTPNVRAITESDLK